MDSCCTRYRNDWIDNYEEFKLLQDNDLCLWSMTHSLDSKQLLVGCSDSHRKRQFGNNGKLCLWQTENLTSSAMLPSREFQHDEYAPQYGIFSKNSEKILAAGPLGSLLYHTESGEVLHKFRNPPDIERAVALRNRPCWSPNESLILSAGALWDSRRARMVHRFESLGTVSNACFHPSGLEVIIGSEMWDLRTFKVSYMCFPPKYSTIPFCLVVAVGTCFGIVGFTVYALWRDCLWYSYEIFQ